MIHLFKLSHNQFSLVSQLVCRYTLCKQLKINLCNSHGIVFEHLKNRKLIKLAGQDTLSFMQGLITNDTRHLENDMHTSVVLPCIFAMMLNLQGRVLYDILLYKLNSSDSLPSYLLECDMTVLNDIMKHLKKYRLRKKVDIMPANNIAIWTVFSDPDKISQTSLSDPSIKDNLEKSSLIPPLHLVNNDGVVMVTKDPRLPLLGHRLLLHANTDILSVIPNCCVNNDLDGSKYTQLRYKLGIGEGIEDYPPGNCFPLECNLDFLHGISFHKGCYIGQELTARTYHTGVIRKRLMPVIFDVANEKTEFPSDCIVQNEAGKNVGKFRNYEGQYGLALLRIEQSLSAKSLKLKGLGTSFKTFRPVWWPQEVTKDESSFQKS